MRHPGAIRVTVLLAIGSASISALGAEGVVPDYFGSKHAKVVAAWLGHHPRYRVASDIDCGCAEDIERERTVSAGVWKANPKYHPYYAAGDFNSDGVPDIAVGVIDASAPGMFRVAIFNGPFSKTPRPKAAFLSAPLRLGQGMFFGAPRPKPHMLVVGVFESEGMVLRPTPKGYVFEADEGD